MTEKPTRRDFLRWTASSLAGLGLAPFLAAPDPGRPGLRRGAETGVGSRRSPRRSPRIGDDGLPPRAVGLRSLGGDFAFDPAGLRLEPGDRLTWLNMGDFHTTTAFHPDNADLLGVDVPLRIPESADPWHSGMLGLNAGTEFTRTFEVAGVHDYFCQPHYSFGMVGRVVVTPPGGPAPAARPATELNEASREEMPPVDAILGPVGRTHEWAARINGVLLLRAHDEAAADPAARLVERMSDDRRLRDLLERTGRAEAAFSSLERFVDAVGSGAGYERLLARADEAKAPLSAAAATDG